MNFRISLVLKSKNDVTGIKFPFPNIVPAISTRHRHFAKALNFGCCRVLFTKINVDARSERLTLAQVVCNKPKIKGNLIGSPSMKILMFSLFESKKLYRLRDRFRTRFSHLDTFRPKVSYCKFQVPCRFLWWKMNVERSGVGCLLV